MHFTIVTTGEYQLSFCSDNRRPDGALAYLGISCCNPEMREHYTEMNWNDVNCDIGKDKVVQGLQT